MKGNNLDKHEKSVLESIERGEWKSATNLKREIKRHSRIARNTLLKNKRINIRISQYDLDGIQSKAVHEGIPYQTLISSILHKYVTGQL